MSARILADISAALREQLVDMIDYLGHFRGLAGAVSRYDRLTRTLPRPCAGS
ncbi:hypothetical protein HQN88_24840 [Paenibacillus qinlingensis]|nr:hypothetical protein [Paenibacillus qinlingensis]